jgi:hypothetical protein
MRTNTQEALSAYIVSIGKRTPRDAAQEAAELCRLANSLNRLNADRDKWRSALRRQSPAKLQDHSPRLSRRFLH